MDRPLHLLDDNFQSQLAAKCDLLLYIGSDVIQYAIIDHVQDQLKCIYESENGTDPQEFLTEIVKTHPYLKYHYRKVKVCFETFKFTFIPNELFAEADVLDYAKFIGATKASEILKEKISKSGLYSVSILPEQLKSTIISNLPDAEIYTQANPTILAAHQQFNGANDWGLYVILRSSKLEFCLIENSELKFYNIFECKNADEFNFYLLNIINQYGLIKDNTHVFLAGSIVSNNDYYQRTAKYFNEINFADITKLITKPPLFETISGQEFFPLLSQNLCA